MSHNKHRKIAVFLFYGGLIWLLWDLKTPDGNEKRTIDNQFKNISKQISDAPGGMIMDCSNLSFTNNEIIVMASKRIR